MRKTNRKGIDLIKKAEGLRLQAYYCPAGVLTIGYGHTGDDVHLYQEITEAQATALLEKDLQRFESAVESAVDVPITDDQFAALVSFVYNNGADAFRKSTLLKLLNQGKHAEAGDQLLRWVWAGGKKLVGLENRRKAERELYYSQPFLSKS